MYDGLNQKRKDKLMLCATMKQGKRMETTAHHFLVLYQEDEFYVYSYQVFGR